LKKLEELYLWENNIIDVKPLSSLNNLLVLDISQNKKLQDVTSLSNLRYLQALKLSGNRYLPKKCPLLRASLCVWN
jgi:internalin A